ncbi:RNA polymerase II transcription factor B subunit 3 [Hondaea fermentalgiana]|uniref:RNA polymerase II transcription factor B subunit 3 n=1 Tax=Hondaea fermentalgiana TaxID=2315210 RepID=A0A2R5GVI0_9STRA|nr:RNA polymerase II transcription factor B subunit 3 [Hondaea fermentalgiana]|eukprot:GBG34847.1 RNA polymerase II transcription factor B subunit 3 [Hondaea fermentalgiana]
MLELLTNLCAFCNNKNLNFLETSFNFKTSAECGHQVCSNCYHGPVFQSKKVVPCPTCGKPMKKAQLKDKSWEQLQYEKEVKIRREVMRIFNLARDDFETQEEFENFRELGESIVWHRMNGVRLEWAEETLEQIEAKYRPKIQRRRAIVLDERRRFAEKQVEENERKREELLELMEAEEEERALRRLEQEEGVQVELGERRRSKVAEIRARKKKEQEEARERAAIQQGYGPQVVQFNQGAQLWTAHQLETQPRKENVQISTYENTGPDELRRLRQEAGGLDRDAASKRTHELILAGLLGA